MRTLTRSERLERAYATLELRPGISAKAALQQYRRLVKRWHPDLYANDPQGQADASQRMRQINEAFAAIRPSLRSPSAPVPPAPPPRPSSAAPAFREPPPLGSRLRPEDVDSIVESLRGPSMFERLFTYLARVGLLLSGSFLVGASSQYRTVFGTLLGGTLMITSAASALGVALPPVRWRRPSSRTWYNR